MFSFRKKGVWTFVYLLFCSVESMFYLMWNWPCVALLSRLPLRILLSCNIWTRCRIHFEALPLLSFRRFICCCCWPFFSLFLLLLLFHLLFHSPYAFRINKNLFIQNILTWFFLCFFFFISAFIGLYSWLVFLLR